MRGERIELPKPEGGRFTAVCGLASSTPTPRRRMRKVGLEPTRPEGHRGLSTARLPISPQAHERTRTTMSEIARPNGRPQNEKTPRAFAWRVPVEISFVAELQRSLLAARKQRLGQQAGGGPQGSHGSVLLDAPSAVKRFRAIRALRCAAFRRLRSGAAASRRATAAAAAAASSARARTS